MKIGHAFEVSIVEVESCKMIPMIFFSCPFHWSLLDRSFPSAVPAFAPRAQFGSGRYLFAVNFNDVGDKEVLQKI
jgi:hypothetical protein